MHWFAFVNITTFQLIISQIIIIIIDASLNKVGLGILNERTKIIVCITEELGHILDK